MMNKIQTTKSKRILCLILALVLLLFTLNIINTISDTFAQETEEETAKETIEELTGETNENNGSISGFLWVDGNGSLKTDWDGLYNGSEYPLVGYTVSLYAADNLTTPIARTPTDLNGLYIFEELVPGNYAVGLTSDTVYGTEYLLPTRVTGESVFTVNRNSVPVTAYSETINIIDGKTVKNINAGMRLPMAVRAAEYTLADLWSMPLYGTLTIDNIDWVKIRTKTVDHVNCVLLLKLRHSYANSGNQFNNTGSTNYEGSQLQTRMTGEYTSSYFSKIRPIAIKPYLGTNHSSTTATSEPNDSTNKVVMAGSATKDIAFALSYKDVFDLNGGRDSPLNSVLQNLYDYYPMLLRTSVSSALLYGIRWNADKSGTIDKGIQPAGSQVSENPAVWVKAGVVQCKVTVRYINTKGEAIGTPTYKDYNVDYGSSFTLNTNNTNDVPDIPYYKYAQQWKAPDGTLQNGGNPNIPVVSTDGMVIYLIYKEAVTDVTVSKTVTGGGDKTKKFTFTIRLADSNGNLLRGTVIRTTDGDMTLDNNGEAQFTLSHGQTITIYDVTVDSRISVAENAEKYYYTYIRDSYISQNPNDPGEKKSGTGEQIIASAARTFYFTNERIYVPPTGIDTGGTTAIIMLPMFMILAGISFIIVKKAIYSYRKRMLRDE